MKIRDYIEFGAEKLANNAFRTMLGMLLSLVAFIVMVIGLFYYYSGNVGSFLADMSFDVEADKVGVVVVNANEASIEEDQNEARFYKRISELQEITGFGGGYEGCITDIASPELIAEQSNFVGQNLNGLNCVIVNNKLGAKLSSIKLKSGKYPDEIELSEGEELIYLGADFSDTYVGKKYGKYVIGGILKPGALWFSCEIYSNYVVEPEDFTVELNDKALVIKQVSPIINVNYFTVAKHKDLNTIIASIEKIAKEECVDVDVMTMKTFLKDRTERNSEIAKKILVITCIIMLYVIFSFVCQQLISLIYDKSILGIYYSNGMNLNNQLRILLSENVLKFIPVYILAVITLFVFMYTNGDYESISYFAGSVAFRIFGSACLAALVISVATVILISVVPSVWLLKQSPVSLIRDNKNHFSDKTKLLMILCFIISFAIVFMIPYIDGSDSSIITNGMYLTSIFAVCNCYYVSKLWILKKRREIAIREVCGERKGHIIYSFVKMFFFVAIVSLSVAFVLTRLFIEIYHMEQCGIAWIVYLAIMFMLMVPMFGLISSILRTSSINEIRDL